jgi:hypothetical protein
VGRISVPPLQSAGKISPMKLADAIDVIGKIVSFTSR